MIRKALSVTIAVVMALTVFWTIPDIGGGVSAATTLKAKTTSGVNVRSKANASSNLLGTLEKGKTFTVKGAKKGSDGNYWYKLNYNSKTGFISGKYAVRTGLPTKSMTATKGTVTGDSVYLRLGPGTSYCSAGKASRGDSFNVNGTAKDSSGGTWYRVYGSDGFKLYISASYIKLKSSTASSGNSSSNTTTQSTTLTMKGKTKDSVNVRAGAGTGCKKKGTLAKGKKVTITGIKKASSGVYWYIIKYSGKGYVHSGYIARLGYTTTSITKTTGTITGTGVRLRLGPGTTYPIFKTADKGATYTVTGKSTDSSGYVWYRVKQSDGLILYVGSNNVSLASGSGDSSEITTSGITYPETLAKGNKFSLKGKLTSTLKMTKVVTGITDSSGEWLSGYKVVSTPNSTTYSIAENVDASISFGKLDCGTYYYRCVATTSAGSKEVFNYKFTVKAMATIKVTGLSYPTVHNQYKSFSLKGTIKCSEKMTKLTIGIAKSNGSWRSGHYVTVKPNSKSYNVANVDDSIKFGDLSTGSYIYRCYVTSATGKQTAFSYSFTVNKNTGIPSAIGYGDLSGNQRKDIVTIAMAQVGYNTNKENHTVYNLWYYGSDTAAAWCAIFVSWCANRAGVSTGVIPKMAYVPSITSWYKNKGRFNAKKTLPKKGDLIIYAGSCHIGIVAANVTSTSGYVSTIEGNTGNDEVKYRKNYMKWNSSAIQGYCRPAYK